MTMLEKAISDYLYNKQLFSGIYVVCITTKETVCTNVCVNYHEYKKKHNASVISEYPWYNEIPIIHGYTHLQEVILTHGEIKAETINF